MSAKKQFQDATASKSFGAQMEPAPRDERLVMTQTSKNFDAIEAELMRKVRDLTKRSEELTDDVRTLEEQNVELRSEKNRLQLQLEEMRTGMRTKLNQYNADYSSP